MENFMNGFSGHEYQARAELRKTLGQDKYEYYFDKVGRHALC
jgi:putative aminopeptidase FrvX